MRAIAITLGLIIVSAPSSAQIGNPAGLAPNTRMEKPGVPAPGHNYQDNFFAQLASAGGSAEVELGKLAANKTGDEVVKRFADRMVTDHRKANDQLTGIAGNSNIPLPSKLDPDRQQIRDDLEKLNGAQFDLAYISAQIVDHQKTAQLLAWEIGNGQNAELQRFAAQVLPTVLEHLEMARRSHAELASQGAPGHPPN
jgi:putative membrane protein